MRLTTIKDVRRVMNWSTRELSKRTGFSGAYIGQVETGIRPASDRLKRAVSKAFTDAIKNNEKYSVDLENNA